ncbi:MAG: alpha/beta hydrolase, partial [Planctomycetia bacterium]|nr:alpha/beta hydrolase [Planctomycetia bacterium]
ALAVDLARRGYVAAAIEYRLAAEAAFPAAIHDCLAAVRFLRLQASVYSIDPDRIAAVGGSAGGHLVGLMASGGTNPLLAGDGGNPSASSEIQLAVVMAGPLQIASGQVAERSLTAKDSNALVWFRGTAEEKPEVYALADAFEQMTSLTVIPNGKHGCWNRLPWFTTITDRIAEILAQQFGQAGMLEPAGNEE